MSSVLASLSAKPPAHRVEDIPLLHWILQKLSDDDM